MGARLQDSGRKASVGIITGAQYSSNYANNSTVQHSLYVRDEVRTGFQGNYLSNYVGTGQTKPFAHFLRGPSAVASVENVSGRRKNIPPDWGKLRSSSVEASRFLLKHIADTVRNHNGRVKKVHTFSRNRQSRTFR